MQGKKTKTGKRQGIGKKDKQINQEKKKKEIGTKSREKKSSWKKLMTLLLLIKVTETISQKHEKLK